MVEPGTYPDPDEPQALIPDSVDIPETGEEFEAPADQGPVVEIVAETGEAEGDVADAGSSPVAPGRAKIVGAAIGRGVLHGAGLVRAYPRAAVATGLSVLVLCGVMSLKSRRAPELQMPPSSEPPTAKGEKPTEAPKVAAPGSIEKPEKLAAPAPVVPAEDLDIPTPAPASGEGIRQTAAEIDAPDLPPELDASAVEPDDEDGSLPPVAGLASSLLAFNDLKPEDPPAPAPAPAAEAPTIATPKVEAAPPAPAPAVDLPPENAPPAEAPAPSPAAAPPAEIAPAPAAMEDLPPVIPAAEPAGALPPADAKPTAPAEAPAPTPIDIAPAPSPTPPPASPNLTPAANPEPQVAPVEPQPAATLPQATTAAELPAFEPTPGSRPSSPAPVADAKPDGDWLPLKHSSTAPKFDDRDMDLTDDGFDSFSGRGDGLFRDSPLPTNSTPVRAVGSAGTDMATAAVATATGTAAAMTAEARTAARRDEGRMETILHKVQPGENFWTISRTHYASGRYYKALGQANADQFQRLQDLYVGAVIRIPPPEDLDAALIEPPGGRSARNSDPDAAESTAPQTASTDAPTIRRARRLDGELNLPVSDPEAERVSDRDDRRRRSPREEFEEPAPRRAAPVHKVRSRETLRSIARDRLGDSRRAHEILDLNRDSIPDPARLPVGQVIDLPDDAE